MSRRRAEDAVAAGRVVIEGKVAVLGDRVDVTSQHVLLDGLQLPINPALETHLLYKPVGVISTAQDPRGRPTVVDLIATQARIFPVGRLDADSEGLILVSNDGELANLITHPRYGITKRYTVLVEGQMGRSDVQRLRNGVALDDGMAKAIEARIRETSHGRTLIEMTMGEGRNREIRRMVEALGGKVLRLVRIAIGPVTDRHLSPGQSRRLSAAEIVSIRQAVRSR